MCIRQRLKKYAVHQAEDRCIDTDPQRQRKHHDDGKTRMLAQGPRTVAKIVDRMTKVMNQAHKGSRMRQSRIVDSRTKSKASGRQYHTRKTEGQTERLPVFRANGVDDSPKIGPFCCRFFLCATTMR